MQDQNPKSLSVHEHEIWEAESLKGVFRILAKFVSFFNFELMDHLIKQLGNEEDKKRLTQYENDFHQFCRHRVCEWPQQESTRKKNTISVKLKDDFQSYTIEAVKLFQHKLCRILEVSDYSIVLLSVSDGCTELSFFIASSNALHLPLTDQQKQELQAINVLKLTCGDHHFNSEVEKEVRKTNQALEDREAQKRQLHKTIQVRSHTVYTKTCIIIGNKKKNAVLK